MPLDPTPTLDTLASASPAALRHLIRLGLDPLQDGSLTLAEACAPLGLDPEATARDLAAHPPQPRRDWTHAPLTELIEHIVTHHHAFTRDELVRIQKLVDRALAVPGPGQVTLIKVKVHIAALTRDLVAHFQMEERNLFPAIRAIEHGAEPPLSLSTPTEQARTITAEHEVAEELFHTIRMLTGDYAIPAEAGRDYRLICLALRNLEEDLHLHLFLENHILFPRSLPR
ncbi:hemerythrin domain-containing protein [Mesoterricola sediminis]|uniref:Iron-sulfur cluster repair di-iron protein n=1 Tax=Mesoterricola sediminis TaxID=2927980 RepID=A0AA48KEP3_9BACT|nr:hemerythrin domain-containing protein [Mesoterricola sediminis]BDU77497.1 iron-sulfur cluster repair di-iron protein [Mesoterricola sediminis]